MSEIPCAWCGWPEGHEAHETDHVYVPDYGAPHYGRCPEPEEQTEEEKPGG